MAPCPIPVPLEGTLGAKGTLWRGADGQRGCPRAQGCSPPAGRGKEYAPLHKGCVCVITKL